MVQGQLVSNKAASYSTGLASILLGHVGRVTVAIHHLQRGFLWRDETLEGTALPPRFLFLLRSSTS